MGKLGKGDTAKGTFSYKTVRTDDAGKPRDVTGTFEDAFDDRPNPTGHRRLPSADQRPTK